MGTPDFAVPALQKLIASEHEVVAVYTKEPKPAGRGYEEIKSKTHLIAEANAIPVYTPKNFKNPEDIDKFISLKADIAVVAAYGLILPKAILEGSKHGSINIHPSRLPRWRGAAPLHHTILAGDATTAVCVMNMDEGLDTGDIYLMRELAVPETMTAKELHDITAELGGTMVLEVLDLLATGQAKRIAQSNEGIAYAHKLTRDHEKIDWSRSAFEINCQVRAFSPRPGAYFTYKGEAIKVISAEYQKDDQQEAAGTVLDDNLNIACGSGILKPLMLQREGKKVMDAAAFLRGYPIHKGEVLL